MLLDRADSLRYSFAAMFGVTALFLSASQAWGATPKGESFSSPEEAAKMLVKAAEARDNAEVLRILGPSAKEILETGDRRLLAQKAPAKGLTLVRVEYPKEEEGD